MHEGPSKGETPKAAQTPFSFPVKCGRLRKQVLSQNSKRECLSPALLTETGYHPNLPHLADVLHTKSLSEDFIPGNFTAFQMTTVLSTLQEASQAS